MPRRTRRSDDPSAAVQSDNASADTTATNEPSSEPAGQEPHDAVVKPRTTRRRTEPKTTESSAESKSASADASLGVPETPAEKTPRPRSRSRSPRSAAKTTVDAAQPTEELTSPAPDISSHSAPEPSPAPSTHRPPPPLRRRVGGRRTLTEAESAASATPPDDGTIAPVEIPPTTTGRSRRRRGGKSPVAAVTDESTTTADSLVDVDAAVTESPDELAGGTEEEKKRSRRSRRGGRRRSGRSASEEGGVDEPEVETVVVDDDSLEAAFPVFSTVPRWTAPALVPSPQALGLSPIELRCSANLVEDLSGFNINGNFVAPELFFVNAETAEDTAVVSEQIKLAASIGIHLHSGVAYLPLKNAYGNRSFASVDSLLKQVLDSDPDGSIFIRLQCVPTNFWARTHPEDMSVFSDGTNGDVSFASRTFWSDTVDALAALLQHLADPEVAGGDRVVGIHLDKGEWFNDANAGYDYSAPNKEAFRTWLHEHYQSPFALRAAWFSGTGQFDTADIPKWPGSPASRKREDVVLYSRPQDRRYVDYNAFTSDLMGQAITGVAEAIKWLSNGKLLVGASYGYTFEFASRNDSGHQALAKILESPNIDVVAGPNSYSTRQAGAAGSFSSPIDSAKLHGKLWIVEDDTKTFLAADETEDAFNPKVSTSIDTVSVLRRNASAALVHGCGVCWMDLWGHGWLNSPELWSEIAELRTQSAISRQLAAETKQVPEVAVFVDEASYNYVCGDPSGIGLQAGLIGKSRELIYRSGASVGFYLQSDVALVPDGVKLYLFLNPLRVTTKERQAIREKLQKSGKTLAWMYAPGLFDERGDSPTEVSEIVGMPLKAQPWNSHIGTTFTEERHPVTERLHGGKRLGSDEVLNPSYAVVDPAATILGEYAQSGAASIAAKVNEGGWKSVFIGEPHLTGELLRGLYRYAGIHVYDMQDDIVHASNNGALLIHSPYTGQRTVYLPRPAAVYSLYEHRLLSQQGSTFRTFMRGRSTSFLLWGDLDSIAEALGTTSTSLQDHYASWKAERDNNQQRDSRGQSRRESTLTDGDGSSEYVSDETGEDDRDESTTASESLSAVSSTATSEQSLDVTQLVDSGLIAGDMDLVDIELDLETLEPETPSTDTAPVRTEQMSPSRRRRWNRKRNMQAAKNTTPPTISMEEFLSDLPPRKINPPKPPEA